jgi:multiple sugar transport system substrate-binding protein
MEEEPIFQNAGQNGPSSDPNHPENPVNFSPQGPHISPQGEPLSQAPAEPAPVEVSQPESTQPENSAESRENSSDGEKKKKIITILIGLGVVVFGILIILFLLSLFKGGKKQQVTLTYWGLWEDKQVMQPVISSFEKENPNIKIEYSLQDPKEYRERLLTRIENGSGPDIFRFHNTWYPMLSGVLLPIPTNVMDRSTFEKSFYSVAAHDLIQNGAIYGIPLEIDTLALYINKDLFSAAGLSAPATWQDLRSSARLLTVKDESGKIQTAGVAAGTFGNVSHAPDITSLLFAQNGVNLSNIKLTDQRVVDALKFYTSFAQGEDSVWDSTLDPSLSAFSKGSLAMFFGYSWDYFNIKAANPNLPFEIVPVPQLSSDQSLNVASYWVEGVSSKSKNQKEALLFLKYLTSKNSQEILYTEQSKTRAFGEAYSYKDLAPKLKDTELKVFLDQAPTAVSSYFVDSTYDNGINQQLNKYLENAINSILENTSAESASATLEDGFTQVMAQYASK